MLKNILRYTLYIVLASFVIVGAIIIYLFSNKQEIVKLAVNQLNQQITAKIELGDADLELFRQFPKVSLDLSNVTIKDPIKQQNNLLEAKHVYIGFNLFDIIRKNYRIKLINIDSASLNLIIDKSGKGNFDILKKDSEEEQKNESFLLELKKVVFSRVQVVYLNKQSKQHYQANVHNMELTGNFSSVGEEVACKGNFDLVKSDEALTHLIKGKTIALDLAFKVNHNTATYTFAKGLVDIDKLQLSLSGQVQKKPKGLNCDVKIGARNLDIPSVLSLFPSGNKIADDYTSKGSLYFTGTIIGEYNQHVSPAVNLEFGIENGQLSNNAEISLKDIRLKGRFSNGKTRNKSSCAINLSNFSFKLNNDEVKGRANISNFNDPMIDMNLIGQLEAGEAIKFSKSNWVKSAKGNVAFNIDFKGKVSDVEKKHFSAITATGKLTANLSDIQFEQLEKGINKLEASFTVTPKDVLIEQFIAQVNESDVKITGELTNFIPYLLLTNQVLTANIRYQSDFIDLNHFVLPVNESATKKGEKGFELLDNISIHATVETGKLQYNQFLAQKTTAIVNWTGKQIQVEDFNSEAFGGKVNMDGQIENAPDGRFLISLSANLANINMNQLFKVCNNFGQTEITDKHINGNLSGTVDMASVWSNNLVCDLNKLYVLANIQLDNGELNGYKPLESLSKYIDVTELRNVKFATLKNTIQIKDKTIIIPTVEIKNSALNITMQGTHTFENYLDYKLKIRLNDLLNKKRKPMENEFNEETPEGGANLYLSMKGPINNIKITHDRKETKKQIKQDIKLEKQNVKEILKKELGITPENTIKEKEKDTDELEFEKD